MNEALSRRDILKGGVALAASALAGGVEAKSAPEIAARELVPEFERQLKVGFFSFGTSPRGVPDYWGLVELLPKNSKLFGICTAEHREWIEEQFAARGLRITLSTREDLGSDYWGRDIGITLIDPKDERIRMVISGTKTWDRKHTIPYAGTRKKQAQFLQKNGIEIIEAPFPFDGGNVAFDERGRVIVGYDVIQERGDDDAPFVPLDPKEYARRVAVIKKLFNATDIVVLGNRRQSELYHIDLSMVLLPGNRAIVVTPSEEYEKMPITDASQKAFRDEVVSQQKVIRQQLVEAGYEVIDLEHGSEDLKFNRTAVNVIPYKIGAEYHVIVPVYPDHLAHETKSYVLGDSDVRVDSLPHRAQALYEKQGCKVHFVRTAGVGISGPHCILQHMADAGALRMTQQG